jgi:hypothetical protein
MKNEFYHKEYDPSLKAFISQLFFRHIYSLKTPNLLGEDDSDAELNVMDYLFKKLNKEELLEIEKMINNEKLYNKETVSFQLFKSHKSKKRRVGIDHDPLSNMNLFRIFKDRVDKGPNVHLPIDKKIRVFEAIDDGLSKYMPKKRKMNFSMMIQMVEILLENQETKEYILEKLNPPPGRMYSEELKRQIREKKERHKKERESNLQETQREEEERKANELEKKHSFFNKMNRHVIEVEELTEIQYPEIEEEKQEDKAVKFITEVPDHQSEKDREVEEINLNKRGSLAFPDSLNKSTTITTKQFAVNSVRGQKLKKSYYLSKDSTINRDGGLTV